MVLSNSKACILEYRILEILNPMLTKLLQVQYSTFHSNRIKIQEILLILQLETDYFSSYSFQK